MCVTFGILLPFGLGVFFQEPKTYSQEKLTLFIDVTIAYIPIGFSILQILLMLTIYRYDTPVFLNQKKNHNDLKEFLGKIYTPYVVQEKIEELQGVDPDNSVNDKDDNNISFMKVLSDP